MLLTLRESLKQDYADLKSTSDINFDAFVEVVHDFKPSRDFDDVIMAEVESLGLLKKSRKPQTQWLSLDSRDYCYADNYKIKHPPKDITNFLAICSLMRLGNHFSGTKTNL